MRIEERDLTDSELAMATAAYAVAPRGCLSSFAYYGLYVVFIPMAGGGLIAQCLRLVGVAGDPAAALGIALASLASAALFAANRRVDRREQRQRESAIQSLRTSGRARTYIATVEKLWEVTDHDHGPAYLVQLGPETYLYLSSFSPQIEAFQTIRRELEIRVAEPAGLVIFAEATGPAVSFEERRLAPEDISTPTGAPADFALFRADELPAAWRQIVAPAR